ncbi:MAG: hypothetical protein HY401_09545 [Elusimicrobia bacterium]|nr:hypothetical protein [Elusimicrobiota bacterium]
MNPVVERGPASTRGEPSGLVLGSGGKGDSPALNPYERLGRASDFSASGIEALLKEIAKEFGWKNGEVYHPLRFAVSGRLQGPSLFHMVEALGPERVAARIKRLQGSLKEAPLK